MKTQIIAGHKIRLQEGRQYRASRPMASRFIENYPVSIVDITDGYIVNPKPIVWSIENIDFDAANTFLAEFNNGEISFAGRTW